MRTSEQIDKIAEALAKAQGEMRNPEKNKTATIPMKSGGKYSYDYADLPHTFDTVRAALAKHGLSHTCVIEPDTANTTVFLTMLMMHASGQWIQSSLTFPSSNDPKQIAALITYYRRYLFTAITGLAADDDFDSVPEDEAATYTPREAKPRAAPAKKAPTPKIKEGTPGAFIPSVGKFEGVRLGDVPIPELKAYMETSFEAFFKSGKTPDELPPNYRDLYQAAQSILDHEGGR